MIRYNLKALLPNRPLPLPILGGPFRGTTIQLNPQCSLQKIFGLYEHELNEWLKEVLPQTNIVLDVGTNDEYFTFGCAAAFRRFKNPAQVFSFEPIDSHFRDLQATLKHLDKGEIDFYPYHKNVGVAESGDTISLDAIFSHNELKLSNNQALIKIDVEGAELYIISGASKWLSPRNFFLIEVHHVELLPRLQQQFSEHGIALRQVDQQPLPFLGRETRSALNWWLVSDLQSPSTQS